MMNPTYVFAKSPEEISDYVTRIWEGTHGFDRESLSRRRFAKAYAAYYGLTWSNDYSISKAGEQNEFSAIVINELRSNIKSVISMTTQNRVVFDCVTTSTDVQAQNNVIIGNTLLEKKFYVDKVEAKCRQVLEQGLVFDTCYMYVGFKTDDKLVGVDGEGKPVYKGSVDTRILSKLDVMVEPSIDQWEDHEYVHFRRLENRYNLAAKYPEVAEEILRMPIPNNIMMVKPGATAEEQANVWVFYTFHKPTKALPQGLMHVCLDEGITLFSDVNPYECLPVVCYRPAIVPGSSHGHALSYDLMPIQEALDVLDSSMLTMSHNFAIPNIIAGSYFQGQETAIAGGMKLVTGTADKDAPNGGFPMAMDMPKPDPVYLQLDESYQQRMMSLAGQNAAARGQTQAQQSGTAIALAQAAAQTFNSSVESGYTAFLEDVACMLLRVCRLFLTREEIIESAGLSLEFQASTFANASLDSISSVKIDLGSALGKTVSGRLEIGTQLLNQGQINATEYMSILQTGNLPKVIQSKTSGATQVQYQVQQLMAGQKPVISALDNQIEYINAYKGILDIPSMRENSSILALVMEVIEERLSMFLQLQQDNPSLVDIAMGLPLGTTMQANMGMVQPQQPPQPSSSSPESGASQSAQAALEGGSAPVAEAGRETADRKLQSVGGEPQQ